MRVGFQNIHRSPSQGLMAVMRRGMGQTGCPGSLNDALQSWLSSLSAELPVDAAVGCGPSGGAPCGSPAEASQMANVIAEKFCALAASVAGEFACNVDPACSNPDAAAAPYAAQALSLFQGFPASVWTTEAANAASGNYYGSIGTEQGPAPNVGCGPGQNGVYLATVNGAVVTIPCGTPMPSGAAAATAPAFVPQSPIQYGPPVSASTGAPLSSAPAPTATYSTPINSPSGSPAGSSGGSTSSSTSSGGTLTDSLGWFTQSIIGGIPNWALVAAGVAALVFVIPMMSGGRR